MMKRIFKALFLLTLVLGACAALILISEILLRKIAPVFFCNTVKQFRYDPELGVVAKSNLNFSLLTDHLIEVKTNDIGSRNFASEKVLLGYKHMLYCVGDSYTEGVGNLADESYPFYLDLILNQVNGSYQKNFAVLNLGVGGYGSIQAAKVVERYRGLLKRNPDIILYLICDNDFGDDIRFLKGMKHNNLIEGNPEFPVWLIRLNEKMEFFQFYSRVKTVIGSLRKARRYGFVARSQPSLKNITADNLENFLPGLREMQKTCDLNHSRLWLSYTGYTQPMYDIVKNYAAQNQLGFVDYRNEVLKTAAGLPSLPVYQAHSGGHFRSWVNLTIARKAAEMVTLL